LCIQDGTTLNFTHLEQCQGLGVLNSARQKTLYFLNAQPTFLAR